MTEGKTQLREGGSWRFLPPPNTAKRIMLPNERFALACRAYYESIGLVVDAANGEFAHCPYPKSMGKSGYYLLHDDHQHQGILQSKDVGRRCFFVGVAKKWLVSCEVLPDNYFELWDIYEKFANRGEHHPLYGTSASTETRKKMSIARKRRVTREETRRKLSEAHKGLKGTYGFLGKSHTEETLEKMRSLKWWVMETGQSKRSFEQPGPEWQQGRKWKVS